MRRELKLVMLGVLAVSVFSLFFTNTTEAQNGSLYLSPSSGKSSVGETFSLALRVNTGGTAINSAEGSIVFNQRELSVISISKSNSIFSVWASEPKFSNAEGTIEFAGGIPNPGYSGSNGLILTVNFRSKIATTIKGYTDIVLVSGAVLANDGEGTNILASLGKATYFISPAGASILPPEEAPTISRSTSPQITSTTHPNQEKWYLNSDPIFKWELPKEIDAVSYLITDTSTSNPGTIPDGLVDVAKFMNIADGVNYFHLRFRENGVWGPISHFKFQIDTKPPKEFNILVTDNNLDEPKIIFESSDDLSGIDHYDIRIDKKDWVVEIDKLSAGKPYSIVNQGYGEHHVLIRAVDGAGNSITASTTVTIPGGIWGKFVDMTRGLFKDGLFSTIAVALIALSHEFFVHSKLWKKLKKNLKLKRGKKNNILNLRDIKKK